MKLIAVHFFLSNLSSISTIILIVENLICTDVLAMILIATNEAISRPKYSFAYQPLLTFATLLISMSFVCLLAFGVILRPSPLWNPQYIIPLCGMLLGNTINGTSLSVTNLTTQIMEGGRREVELCLSFGASSLESIKRLMKDAISVGVTPMINQLNVIGLVSIPGKWRCLHAHQNGNANLELLIDLFLKQSLLFQRNDDWSDSWRLASNGGCTLSNTHHLVDINCNV